MNDVRPTVSPQLLAAAIESAPDRVRRRLDRSPDAAAGWQWLLSGNDWTIDTGGEKVKLPRENIHALNQLSCTCLLTPNCFHVLACLTALKVALADGTEDVSADAGENQRIEMAGSSVSARDTNPTRQRGPSLPKRQRGPSLALRVGVAAADIHTQKGKSEAATPNGAEDVVQPTESQQRAGGELARAVAQLLRVGAANAGVVVQSGVLRACTNAEPKACTGPLPPAYASSPAPANSARARRSPIPRRWPPTLPISWKRLGKSSVSQPCPVSGSAPHVAGKFLSGLASCTGCSPNRLSRAAATPAPPCIFSAKMSRFIRCPTFARAMPISRATPTWAASKSDR